MVILGMYCLIANRLNWLNLPRTRVFSLLGYIFARWPKKFFDTNTKITLI